MRSLTLISLVGLLLSIAAWVGVVFLYQTIQIKESERNARHREIAETSRQENDATRLKALMSETKAGRAALDQFTAVDILSAVKTIEGVGKPAGVSIRIENAIPGDTTKSGELRSITFVISAEGTFSEMIRTIQLFEAVPLPASIEQVDLSQQSGESDGKNASQQVWHVNVRLKLLTSTRITS